MLIARAPLNACLSPSGRPALRWLRAAGVGAVLLVCGTSSLQNAVANGDTRTLSFHHTHSGESGTFTFKKDGRYDPAVLDKLNYFLRDWRNQKSTKMDPHLFDIIWEVYREVDGTAPLQIISSYRSPETNSLLRSRSRGVAKFSQHMLGKAMDFYIPGVKLSDIREAGLRLQRGGVGFYPTSGSPFVHLDTGSIRHWPRMTHDQLARVFPDGKTVHIPSDGKPLSHYQEALAMVHSRGNKPISEMASAYQGKNVKQFIAGMLGKKTDSEAASEETSEETTRVAAAPLPSARPVEMASAALLTAQLASAPMPLRRPAALDQVVTQQVASLSNPPLPSVITRGTPLEGESALGYAAVGELSAGGPRRVASLGPLAPASLNTTDGAKPASAVQRLRERGMPPRGAAFGQLFLSPSLSTTLYLRTPELRVFKAFVAPPPMVVAYSFSRDASFGLKSSFSGPAVVALPTYAFRAPPVTLSQRF